MTTLLHHVGQVVGLRPEEQAAWVVAGGVVAVVEDLHPWWDRSEPAEEGETVHLLCAPTPHQASITMNVRGACPGPAVDDTDLVASSL